MWIEKKQKKQYCTGYTSLRCVVVYKQEAWRETFFFYKGWNLSLLELLWVLVLVGWKENDIRKTFTTSGKKLSEFWASCHGFFRPAPFPPPQSYPLFPITSLSASFKDRWRTHPPTHKQTVFFSFSQPKVGPTFVGPKWAFPSSPTNPKSMLLNCVWGFCKRHLVYKSGSKINRPDGSLTWQV